MAQLNFVVRGLVRVLYGTSLIPGSVPEALASYTRAAELNPTRLVHRVEVGRMCERMGMPDEALHHLKVLLVLCFVWVLHVLSVTFVPLEQPTAILGAGG